MPGEFSVAGSGGRSPLERARIRELSDLFHPTDFDLEVGFGPEMGTEAVELGNGWGFQAWAAANSLSADEARSGAWPYSPVEYRSDGKNVDNKDRVNERTTSDDADRADNANENHEKDRTGEQEGGEHGDGADGGGTSGEDPPGEEPEPDDPFGDVGPPPKGDGFEFLDWFMRWSAQQRALAGDSGDSEDTGGAGDWDTGDTGTGPYNPNPED